MNQLDDPLQNQSILIGYKISIVNGIKAEFNHYMSSLIETAMYKAIEFAKQRNNIWPFSTVIINGKGEILCQATDCAHISPLFHAESLAVHALVQNKAKIIDKLEDLILVTTAEPDVLSQSSIHWANIVHDLGIKQIYYGTPLTTIQIIWPFGIDISAREVIERTLNCNIQLTGEILTAECEKLFLAAREKQLEINKNHPAKDFLSDKVEQFYQVYI